LIYNINHLIGQLEENKITFSLNEPMHRHTSFKIGGNADVFVSVQTVEEFSLTLKLCKKAEVPVTVLGKGSNLLVSDKGIEGVVICLEKLNKITVEGEKIKAGAGVSLAALCNFAANEGLSGLEFAFGIPGSVGGAVYMNAGAYGGEIKDVLESVTAVDVDGEILTFSANELCLSYRNSIFHNNGATVVETVFALKKGIEEEIKAQMSEVMGRRKDKQPLEFPSAGSTFKRPEGYFAGTLIEQCGLKGLTVGGAQVSTKHAGFVINKGGATANDVLELIKKVQQIVFEKTGVTLEPEVIFIGRE
jgi:UDP-N-acetylmuramate dehydrogenase